MKKKMEYHHPMLHGHLQGYNDRMDESLGMRRGKESAKKQSMKDRRDESRGMRKKKMSMRRKRK